MQTLDWQEQEHRANEIREILERTLALVQSAGLTRWTQNGWLYEGEEQTLFYNPDSDQLSVFSNDRSWQLDWHEALFIADTQTQISDTQLKEFRELEQWLDNLEEVHSQPTSGTLAIAARLFEQYAAEGELAFKTSTDSTATYYRIEVDDTLYWIGRDDVTGAYTLQREDGEPLTGTDTTIWTEVNQWLDDLDRSQLQPTETFLEAPYWEQQTVWANQLLPQAESVFAFQEAQGNLYYDPGEQSYLADSGDYQIGYSPVSDRFWVERDGEPIISVTQYSQHRSNEVWNWGLLELRELGEIETTDIAWFESWSFWLRLKAEQMENSPDWEATFNRLWNSARSLTLSEPQFTQPEQHQGTDHEIDR